MVGGTSSSGLVLRGVSKRYGEGAPALQPLDLAVAAGELLVLVGPSGCGKSTLLRIVAGLVPASTGTIELDGRDVTALEPRERDVAMVFQNYALYPHMSVARNLAFPLKMRGLAKAEVERRVGAAAELLGLTSLLARKPGTLSGGQMQRVALGRAMVRDPRLFLFDEPLSNLDAKLRGEMRREIAALHRRLGITTLYVTHDQAEAMTLGQRICVLDQGRVEQVGPPLEVYQRPATRFVAAFIGSPAMNLIEGRNETRTFQRGALRVPAAGRSAGPVVLGLRPNEVEVEPGGELEVREVEELGAHSSLALELEGQRLWVTREGPPAARAGERVSLRVPPDAAHWFDAESGRRLPEAEA